jgi:hypothetical protein
VAVGCSDLFGRFWFVRGDGHNGTSLLAPSTCVTVFTAEMSLSVLGSNHIVHSAPGSPIRSKEMSGTATAERVQYRRRALTSFNVVPGGNATTSAALNPWGEFSCDTTPVLLQPTRAPKNAMSATFLMPNV